MSHLQLLLLVLSQVAVAAVIVWYVARAPRQRIEPTVAGQALASGEGQWYARVRTPSFRLITPFNFAQGWGVLRIRAGRMSFTPDDASGTAWDLDVRSVGLEGASGISGSFIMWSQPTGRVAVEVSRSMGARWRKAGDIRGLADVSTASEVVQLLYGWGAHPGGAPRG